MEIKNNNNQTQVNFKALKCSKKACGQLKNLLEETGGAFFNGSYKSPLSIYLEPDIYFNKAQCSELKNLLKQNGDTFISKEELEQLKVINEKIAQEASELDANINDFSLMDLTKETNLYKTIEGFITNAKEISSEKASAAMERLQTVKNQILKDFLE